MESIWQTVLANMGWAALFSVLGGLIGIVLMVAAAAILPAALKRFTPSIDEDKEIVRGNIAVAEYFGRVAAAGILGASIVIAAAIVAGVLAALHGG
jgi:hypothetical protein